MHARPRFAKENALHSSAMNAQTTLPVKPPTLQKKKDAHTVTAVIDLTGDGPGDDARRAKEPTQRQEDPAMATLSRQLARLRIPLETLPPPSRRVPLSRPPAPAAPAAAAVRPRSLTEPACADPFSVFPASSRAPPPVDWAELRRIRAEASLRAAREDERKRVQAGQDGGQPRAAALLDGPDAEDGVVRMLQEKLRISDPPTAVPPVQPSHLNVTLLPYQLDGVRWMHRNERGPVKGGLLADDMGLGKTIQVLALALENRPRERQPMLVVCLLSTLGQWESEAKNRIKKGKTSALVYYGGSRSAPEDSLSSYDIVLTTYGTLTSEFKRKGPLYSVCWWRVVLDEAHMIKNPKTQVAKAACALEAKHRWCLSGTPIQNWHAPCPLAKDLRAASLTSLDDLRSVLCFLRVPCTDRETWKAHFATPLKSKTPVIYEKGRRRLQMLLSHVLLRRTKAQLYNGKPILQLPPKSVVFERVAFSAHEQKTYDSMASRAKQTFDQCDRAGTVMNNYMMMLELILRLRQVCDHPNLALKNQGDQGGRTRPSAAICSLCLQPLEDDAVMTPCNHSFCRDCILSHTDTDGRCPTCNTGVNPDALVPTNASGTARPGSARQADISTKLKHLIRDLKKLAAERPGEKSVVFSQFTSFLDLAQEHLKRHGIACARLDGSMPQKQRTQAIETFGRDPHLQVMIISLKAGGTGLNLTMANHVFLLDPWWNPFTELQAIDRVHRLGQTRPVSVIQFVTQGTIEEKILRLQERKKSLAADVLASGEQGITQARTNLNRLTASELQYLLCG